MRRLVASSGAVVHRHHDDEDEERDDGERRESLPASDLVRAVTNTHEKGDVALKAPVEAPTAVPVPAQAVDESHHPPLVCTACFDEYRRCSFVELYDERERELLAAPSTVTAAGGGVSAVQILR